MSLKFDEINVGNRRSLKRYVSTCLKKLDKKISDAYYKRHGIRTDRVKEYYRQPCRDGGSSRREEKIGGVKRRATRKQSLGRICGCSFLPFSFLSSVFFAHFVSFSRSPYPTTSLPASHSRTRIRRARQMARPRFCFKARANNRRITGTKRLDDRPFEKKKSCERLE